MLEVSNLSKMYGKNVILSDVSFKIKKGQVISIIGKSGCGKSTLLKCINRLEEKTSGEIYLERKSIYEMSLTELRQKIGIVFQDYNLFEHLNVIDNLTIGLIKIKGVSKKSATEEAIKILKKIGLEDKKYNYPDELSGGQRQRIAMARTILMKPSIIMLDEPTSALDKETKIEVLRLIEELVNEGRTLIIVSHEEEFVRKISNRIFKISRKKLIEVKNIRKGEIKK